MRKYNRLKERYYETEFIGDDDSKVGFDVGIPSDFPDWAPEGAYIAFIDCWCDGDVSKWNSYIFSEVYEGEYPSIEDFVEHYFEDDWRSVGEEDETAFYLDDFYDCVDFRSLGQSVKEWYKDDIQKYRINRELPKNEKDSFYVKFLSNHINILSSSNYEIATAYIMAVAKRENLSYRGAVRWIDENKKKILHWDWGIPIINDRYYYKDGFYFRPYY